MGLFSLPNELIEYILSISSPSDFISCLSACKLLHGIISTSVKLQYLQTLHQAGYSDYGSTAVGTAERLEAVRRLEASWMSLKPNFTKIVNIPFVPTGLYDLSSGYYFLSDGTRTCLKYIQLPSQESDQPKWQTFSMNDSHYIVDFAVNIPEFDLMAVLTLSSDINVPFESCDVELHIRQFSTSTPHPLAKIPKHILHQARRIPTMSCEIVGKYLALIVSYTGLFHVASDYVYVLDWKTGQSKMRFRTAEGDTLSGVMFLSEDVIAFTNANNNSIDIWKIRDDETAHVDDDLGISPSPDLTLKLPILSESFSMGHLACRAEPNPHVASLSPDIFGPSAEDSIIIIQARLRPVVDGPFIPNESYTLYTHRRALLDLFLSKRGIIPWVDWGPPGTAIASGSQGFHIRWVTTTCGQRFSAVITDGRRHYLAIYDFNPYNVKRIKYMRDTKQLQLRATVVSETKITQDFDFFQGSVETMLPYVVYATPLESEFADDWSGVLIDQERILGLRFNRLTQRQDTIDILHYG